MARSERRYFDDVPAEVVARLRGAAMALPDVYEEKAYAGVRWKIRSNSFAHVLGVETEDGPIIGVALRADGDDLDMIRHVGHPFFFLPWGRDAYALVLDDETDWDEVTELVTDSYRVRAPKKLIALLDRSEKAELPVDHDEAP